MDPSATLVAQICDIAQQAGTAIMAYHARGVERRDKADNSPVTDADEAANALIVGRLENLTPDIPVIAEESVAHGYIPAIEDDRFWLVDPLDGTKEFISGRDEFTVNIALIESGRPVLGVVGLPAMGRMYWGRTGVGAYQRDGDGQPVAIAARAEPVDGATVVASRSHFTPETEAWLAEVNVVDIRHAGSSHKFCVLAAGEADLYPRLGRTMEWDTAAGDAVLRAAGGSVRTLDGGDLAYGKPGFENPYFIARGK